VNGAPVVTPDVMLGNVTIHVIDGVFLPGGAGEDAAATEGTTTEGATTETTTTEETATE
jgi:hypothetical protein